jgi:formylglycine-generating enzyme required for sulfatase activity
MEPTRQAGNRAWLWLTMLALLVVATGAYLLRPASGGKTTAPQATAASQLLREKPSATASPQIAKSDAPIQPTPSSFNATSIAPSGTTRVPPMILDAPTEVSVSDSLEVLQATKANPFVNSLGMKFVPVPETNVLFCVHETRVADFATFVAGALDYDYSQGTEPLILVTGGWQQRVGSSWRDPGFQQNDNQPVTCVSWKDADAFCKWLSHKEGKTYRLPTDHEWSVAVGIGDREDPNASPKDKSGKIEGVYPWGEGFPPTSAQGNYGLKDEFPRTAPVMSFSPNEHGIFDLGGNVSELCQDRYVSTYIHPVIRGASWYESSIRNLQSSARTGGLPTGRNSHIGFRCVLAVSSVIVAPGSPITIAASTNSPPDPEIRTRIANYQKARHAMLSDLVAKYRKALSTAKQEATKSGALANVGALDAAIAQATALGPVIEKNLTAMDIKPLPVLPKTATAVSEELREIFEREATAIERGLAVGLDQSLSGVQAWMVKGQNTEGAKAVESYRTQLAAFGISKNNPSMTASLPPPPATAAGTGLLEATKDKPFVNSLGMKFVPVPGTDILMCIHETRRRDYAAYAAEISGVDGTWKNQSIDGYLPPGNLDDHPVTRVTWEEAAAFCAWLSGKEGRTCRLPTDREWSMAVGIGQDEKWTAETTPQMLSEKGVQNKWPWGSQWPPPKGAGNYADTAWKEVFQKERVIIDGYTDGFATTAPVMSFEPNTLGLYDMGGNVAEWLDASGDGEQKEYVARGSSWNNGKSSSLLSSYRAPGLRPNVHYIYYSGIRVAMERGSSDKAASESTKPRTPTVISKPKDLDLDLSLEDNRSGLISVKLDSSQTVLLQTEPTPHATLDCSRLIAGKHTLYVSAQGYAKQALHIDVSERGPTPQLLQTRLYRLRYVIIRSSFNMKGGRELSGPDVKNVRQAYSHWGAPRYNGQTDWRIWQGGKDQFRDPVYGEAPWINTWMHKNGFGLLRPLASESYENMSVAPETGSLATDFKAVKGLTLYFYQWGNADKNEGYGKLIVEDITETPPPEIEVVRSKE